MSDDLKQPDGQSVVPIDSIQALPKFGKTTLDEPPRPRHTFSLYDCATFTALILGIYSFAHIGDTKLLCIAFAMAGVEAGVPVWDYLKEIFLQRSKPGKPDT